MGFFDNIKSVFNHLLGNNPQYDDAAVQFQLQGYPTSFNSELRSQIKALSDEIHKVYNTANEKYFTIGVIGDFSVGKSSFVNAILGDNILPVSANPCTAVITKIKYGRQPRVVVKYKDDREAEMTYDEYLKFSAFNIEDFREREITKELRRFKNVEYATVYVKSDFLRKSNLCIVDTLGLAADEYDNKKTIASVKDAIAVIYVCEERGLTDKDVKFISEYLNIERNDTFFCINRIDLVRKSERDDVRRLVELKLDDILQKEGSNANFPASHIYMVSSLYQGFANGFTDHDDYCEGIDYHARSGFRPVMKDISNYVKENSKLARERSINALLDAAVSKVACLRSLRLSDKNRETLQTEEKITQKKKRIGELENNVQLTNTLFENLIQRTYSLIPSLFTQYSEKANGSWHYTMHFLLVDKFSFGFTDYLALERDIMSLHLNIFKSMTNKRYAKLESLSPLVDAVYQYLRESLTPIVDKLKKETGIIIDQFAETHSYQDIFSRHLTGNKVFYCVQSPPDDVKNAMYKAAAQAGIESTWMKNKTRKEKMFDAAFSEGLKALEIPFKQKVDEAFGTVKEYIQECNADANSNTVKQINILRKEVEALKEQNKKRVAEWFQELQYFKSVAEVLGKAKITKTA